MRQILFIIVILAGTLQPWWSSIPGAMAEEPPQGRLALTMAPSTLLADGSTQSVFYIQLLGTDEVPRLASEDTEVSLISSDPGVVSVLDRARISTGESYTIIPLTTSSVSGKAMITVVSRGRASVAAEVETLSPLEATLPFRLALYAAPGIMLPGGQPLGRLSVVLLGANELGVPAPEDLNVVLSSSDPEVVRIAERMTIPRGKHFAITDLEPLAVGSSTLTALSSGFVSEFTW